MSLANPGGGSGTTTLFRPAKYAMGLKAGQLAKDSSVYQVNFRREGVKTIYDVVFGELWLCSGQSNMELFNFFSSSLK